MTRADEPTPRRDLAPTRSQSPSLEPRPSDDAQLLEGMVAAWLAGDADGAAPDVETLCRDRPELLPTLRELLGLVRSLPGAGDDVTADPLLGRTLGGRYRLTARLGAGGMGMVYAARDEELGRDVAVKVLDELFATDAQRVQRFRREAQSLAALDHPHIVGVHDFELTSHPPYLVMDRVVGFDLALLVRTLRAQVPEPQTPALEQVTAAAAACAGIEAAELGDVFARPWPQLVALLGTQMGRALAAAHDVGVVHRDVKPSNFMVDVTGRVRLLDFGLARRDVDVTLTRSDTRVGSPLYMAPEQVRGEEATVACDVYSFGATLYELACLRPPFEGRGGELEAAILHDEPVPPQRRRTRLPRDLGAIALQALHKNIGRRYPSAAAMVDELERFLRFEPVLAHTRMLPAPLRTAIGAFRRYRRAGLVVAVLLVSVGALALISGRYFGERRGRAAADATRRMVNELEAGLSPYLGFAGGKDDRLRDEQRPAQLARLDQLLAAEPDNAVARFLRLWARGEEQPPPPSVAADRQRLVDDLGGARLARLYERVALPVQRRDRSDRHAGRDAMLAALAALDEESRPLDALARRLWLTVALQLLEYDREGAVERADEILELARLDEADRGRTAFSCLARAVALQVRSDLRGARDALIASNELCPGQPATLHNLARVFRVLGQPRRARDLLEPLVVGVPAPHVNYLEQYALVLTALNEFEAADAVLARFPDAADSRLRAAVVRARARLLQASLAVEADEARAALASARTAVTQLADLIGDGRATPGQARQAQIDRDALASLQEGSAAGRVQVCRDLLRDPATGRIVDPLNKPLLEQLGVAMREAGEDADGELLAAIAAALDRLERDGVPIR